jgi:prolyl oligopeptidase
MPLNLPQSGQVEDVIHGVRVADPYRWLEDRSSVGTITWISEQRALHDSYFSQIAGLDVLRTRVAEYLDVDVVDQPAAIGHHCFFRRRDKRNEQPCIYVLDLLKDEERALVDASVEGLFTSVGIHRISDDGSLLAYEVRQGGGDTREIRIVNVDNGEVLPDRIGSGFARGFTFSSGNEGFYYCHETMSRTEDHTIRFHRFGESATQDQVLFRLPRTPRSKLVLTADDHNLGAIFVHEWEGKADLFLDFYLCPREADLGWRLVCANKRPLYQPFLKHGRIFVITQGKEAKTMIAEMAPDGTTSREVVPEGECDIQQLCITDGRIYVSYMVARETVLRSWTLSGEYAGTIDLPPHGSIELLPHFTNNPTTFFYAYESFSERRTIFEYLPSLGNAVPWTEKSTAPVSEPVIVREVQYPSKDGTRIPMWLVMRNDISPASPRPTILTGYGGFGTAMTPQFSVLVTIMVEMGAVFALANIRGGSEFGNAWHEAARGRNRQVAFDDFICAAEWLCEQGITSPEKLAIFGGSNSGLLVGVAMTQRPDLFRAVLCIAPLLDMLRYQHFDQAHKWQREYGSVSDPEDFHALYSYSPYHRVRDDLTYPSTFFVTGDKDDRCNPAHVRKMAARLQDRSAQNNPIIVDYSSERGHSPVLPFSVRLEALTRRVAFLCRELDVATRSGGTL